MSRATNSFTFALPFASSCYAVTIMQTGGASTLIPRLAFAGLPSNKVLNIQAASAVDGCFPATIIVVGK